MKTRISKKKSEELKKKHNSNFYMFFHFFMTSLIHPVQKRALIPLKLEVVFNYDTFFKVAQSYPHGPKLAQLTVPQEVIWCADFEFCIHLSSLRADKTTEIIVYSEINDPFNKKMNL